MEYEPLGYAFTEMQKGLDYVWCQVADMNRAVAFYRDVLGFPLLAESPFWSEFDLGNGLKLGLHPTIHEGTPKAGWAVTIQVDDLLECRAKLEAAGAHVGGYDEIPNYALLMEFKDLDGNEMQLSQHGATKASLGVE